MLDGLEKGIDLMQEGIQAVESTGSKITLSYMYAWYADILSKVKRLQEAEEFSQKSLELDRFGERWGSHVAYRVLASNALQTSDFPNASSYMSQSIQIATERGARPDLAIARYHNAQLFMKQEDPHQAREQLTQATELFSEMKMTWWLEQAKDLEERLG